MAYTPLLGLSLPVTGTLSGTWGDEINNSITSLVDSAVAGTTTLSTDADVTLTTTGGVSNTAREAVLLCTGARTAVRYITAPAQSKTYTVINATTGGFDVYIRGAGPTAGIAVPMGYAVQVAWNSSDFVQTSVPVTKISGLGTGVGTALAINVGTAGSPVVNGGVLGTPSSGTLTNVTGLPISTGVSGLGTNVATALAVNVGTAGSVVVNGGVLGTPSSGTLTNATGLPISTGVSGLGTGVATALAVNVGTAGSPVVNGGALGTPSSGTVTNLTGTASININGTVGATTPAAVSATSLTDSGNLIFTGTGNRITGDFSNATIANRVLFQTSTANTSTIVQTIPSGTGTVARWNLANSSDPANASEASFAATSTEVRVESTLRGTGTYLPMTFYTGGSEKVRVDTSGNVGIGKTPVAGRGVLQVNGDVEMTSQNTGQLAGLRNRIINGAMMIDQRNAGAAVTLTTGTGGYALDRFYINNTTPQSVSIQQVADGPTIAQAGFYIPNCLSVTASTGSTPVAGTLGAIQQYIEGGSVIDLGFGQTGAGTITVSFWVKATVTGTYCFNLSNGAVNRFYSSEYTISATNTWEKKTITIAGDTTGTWLYNTGKGLSCTFVMAVGSTYNGGTNNAWVSTALAFSTANQVNALATTSNIFRITGVQLELGSVATPFEQRPYGMELALCQRYYYRTTPGSANRFGAGFLSTTTASQIAVPFPVTLRTAPTTLEQSGTAGDYGVANLAAGTACTAVPTYVTSSNICGTITFTTGALTAGQGVLGYAVNGNSYLGWSAEL